MCMSVAKEAIRKETGRVNALMKCWGCTRYPRYHTDMLHTYRNWPNNMDPYVLECANVAIQDYAQNNLSLGWNKIYQGIQCGRGQKSSTTKHSMFAETWYQLSQ